MSVNTTVNTNNNEVTARVTGSFGFDQIQDFRQSYCKLDPIPSKFIVDLRDTKEIDSAAIGMLLNMKKFLGLPKEAVQIINPNPKIKKLLEITHLTEKFQVD